MAVFNGTAAELAELTRKHWGAEWWPKHEDGPLLVWPVCSDSDPRGTWLEWIPGQDVTTAASIVFAAAMVWLWTQNTEFHHTLLTGRFEIRHYGPSSAAPTTRVYKPSPLEAVLAAIESAQ